MLSGTALRLLGKHDSLRMVLCAGHAEETGIRMLFNEHEPIRRGGGQIYLAGMMTLISTLS